MRLVTIDLDTEPDCLKKLRKEHRTYDDLEGDCLKKVRALLNTQQH